MFYVLSWQVTESGEVLGQSMCRHQDTATQEHRKPFLIHRKALTPIATSFKKPNFLGLPNLKE